MLRIRFRWFTDAMGQVTTVLSAVGQGEPMRSGSCTHCCTRSCTPIGDRALGLTVRTVARDWERARLFLHANLR